MLRYEQHPFTILNVPDEDGKVVFLVRALTTWISACHQLSLGLTLVSCVRY
jgi:hypothetical protein